MNINFLTLLLIILSFIVGYCVANNQIPEELKILYSPLFNKI